MEALVKNITTIHTGLFAKPSGSGEVVYLQVRHFDDTGQVVAALYPDLKADEIHQRHYLKPGDVLFAAKGIRSFAAVVGAHSIPMVASTSFFIIRQTDSCILPDYLAWFLNSERTLAYLRSKAIGSALPSITKAVLEDLMIDIPKIDVQENILHLAALRKQEKQLQQRIQDLVEKKFQHLIFKAIHTTHD